MDGSCVELQQIGMRFELDAFGIVGARNEDLYVSKCS